jgi:hypothetical protein
MYAPSKISPRQAGGETVGEMQPEKFKKFQKYSVVFPLHQFNSRAKTLENPA